jgi:hypothetical membrane protein
MQSVISSHSPTVFQAPLKGELTSHTTRSMTRHLLTMGVVAGPIYIIVGALEMLLRPGYDIRRHALSVVANGDLGWIHVVMMATTGVLTIAAAVGMRRAMHDQRAGTWGPLLVGLYGVGITGAAFFTADPALGFPPGTPADAREMSWHGGLHILCASIGFLALIAACLVFARRFAATRQVGLAVFSTLTGVYFFATTFTGVLTTSADEDPNVLAFTVIAFTVAVVLAWTWISRISASLRRSLTNSPR